MNGEWLALGAVGAIVALRATSRGGSRADAADLGPLAKSDPKEVVKQLDLLARVLDGHEIGHWSANWCYMSGSIRLTNPDSDWEVLATPGWEGEVDYLPLQVASVEGDESYYADVDAWSKTLAGATYLWTGDLNENIKRWKTVVKPFLDALDAGVHPADIRGIFA